MNSRQEVACGFVITGCDGSVLLEPSEEILDEMSGHIKVPVEFAGGFPVGFWRYNGGFAADLSSSITRLSASKALSAISVSACISGRRWSAPTRSWVSPPVRLKAHRVCRERRRWCGSWCSIRRGVPRSAGCRRLFWHRRPAPRRARGAHHSSRQLGCHMTTPRQCRRLTG
jgi:hypothetical protein